MSPPSDMMRFARTLAHLHPLQIAARLPHLALARTVIYSPDAIPPEPREGMTPPSAAAICIAENERARFKHRFARLPQGRLRDYESAYGLELGVSGEADVIAWRRPVASEPFPASVRARRIAVAVRAGRRELRHELARACRAVLIKPELHLLGNHLLENGLALVCGGAVSCGREAETWFRAGAAILDWQLDEQFLPDGGHFERSATYHVALTYGLLEAIDLTRAAGKTVPEGWLRAAERALAFIAQVRAPDGTYPLFNDAAFDAAPAVDDVLALGRDLGFERAAVDATPKTGILHLSDTGWVVVRGEGAMLVLDAGPDGAPYQPGHVHADALTFELWIGERRAITDYGVASYIADEARSVSRATRSHNTLELDGRDSSEVWSAFRVGRRATGRVDDLRERSDGSKVEACVEASHDGYSFLPGRPTHHRRVELSAHRLRVVDRITCSERRSASPLSVYSSLRADAEALASTALHIEADGDHERARDAWYPEHGVSRTAERFEQRASCADDVTLGWTLRW